MDLTGTVISKGKSGPSNPLTIGVDQAFKNIYSASIKAAKTIEVDQYKYSVFGIAGIERSHTKQKLLKLLSKKFQMVEIVSDTTSALAGATGCKPGLAVIAGTGSNVYGMNENGKTARSGGWGWRIGDEGSGYTIGRNAIVASLKEHDGRGPNTMLTKKITQKLGFKSLVEIVDWTYDSGRQPKDFADLVPLVAESDRMGDHVSNLILSEAGAELGLVANSAIRRLNMKGEFLVACIGGVFLNGGAFNIAFEEVIRKEAPDCIFIEPKFSPTVGSALIAIQKLGLDVDESLLNRIEKSLGEIND
jgi:N-acetylglucosamine kinase